MCEYVRTRQPWTPSVVEKRNDPESCLGESDGTPGPDPGKGGGRWVPGTKRTVYVGFSEIGGVHGCS